jgi:H(+)-translocating pyrophosphatase
VNTVALTLATLSEFPLAFYVLAPIGAITALVTAFFFSRTVMKRTEGDDEMVRIAQAVRDGAMAYLVRQYRVVFFVFIGLVLALLGMAALGLQEYLTALGVPVAGLFSGLCGWFGMKMATNASARTAAAAKNSLNDGLTVAFRSGAVMGLVVVGFALLDVSFWFFTLNALDLFSLPALTAVMLTFGMGASTQALFARVGGGIYTKAADVGADLVGKVEAGIPEDDARNPATIADNVGDNVGDVAGMGADLYESYYGSILATMALGTAAAVSIAQGGDAIRFAGSLAIAPMAIAGLGILCSIIAIFFVRAKEGATFAQLLQGLHKGVYIASALVLAAAAVALSLLFDGTLLGFMALGDPGGSAAVVSENLASVGTSWIRLLGSIGAGLAAGLVIAYATEHYTSYEHEPTRRIARQAITGPATVIISGIAEGMKSTWAALLTVVVAIVAAFSLAGGGENFLMGLYGVGIAAVGMLSTLGITLATDAYGPIADNAGGNAEMTGQPPHVRERTDMLDSLGNTTAATGKGFAIGSAALTALALFAAYLQVVQTQLTSQAEAAAEQMAAEIEQRNADEAQAIYMGGGKFAVVIPPSSAEGEARYDAGLIYMDDLTPQQRAIAARMEAGTIFSLELSDRSSPWAGGAGVQRADERGAQDGDDPHMPPLNDAIATSRFVVARSISPVVDAGDEFNVELELALARNASIKDVLRFYDVSMMNPRALGGIFIGVLLAFLFCAMTMNAVGRAANSMMQECRRQFGKMREAFRKQGLSEEQISDPQQWPKIVEHEGTRYPDYARCVSISTAGAQREMVLPALLAIVVPILVGLMLDVPGVVGMLAGGLTAGFAVAIFMANAGGAWDNAKKLLESYGRITADEFLDDPSAREKVPDQLREPLTIRAEEMRSAGHGGSYVYGKGSEDHKATVVGDTVGDPFKDTSGPSLNILIKLISIVSVVFAGLVVKYGAVVGEFLGLG